MKLKLDENLGEGGRELLVPAGHDVATVPSQGCRRERTARSSRTAEAKREDS
jgi:hypothetical protein